MNLFVLGISHKTAPLDLREKFLIAPERRGVFLGTLANGAGIPERAVLSTCNRTEIYGVTEDPDGAYRRLIGEFGCRAALDPSEFRNRFYFKKDGETVDHLFSVASGLDSMAIGETEILGQVKNAYEAAREANATGRVLNALFQKSLRVGKRVRTETQIGAGKVSLSWIAVDLARKIFSDLSKKNILLIGSGEVARLVCEALAERGARLPGRQARLPGGQARHLCVLNRHPERAGELAADFGGEAAALDRLDALALEADIMIASASAEQPIIGAGRVKGWMKARHGRPLFIIDLGVPRNVEPAAGDEPDTYLYNVDDLKTISERNLASREGAVHECRHIIEAAAAAFMARFHSQFSLPMRAPGSF